VGILIMAMGWEEKFGRRCVRGDLCDRMLGILVY
jgi:hypothetical protein